MFFVAVAEEAVEDSTNPAFVIAFDIRVDIHHARRQDHLLAQSQLAFLVCGLEETIFRLPELINSDISESRGVVS